MKGRYIISVHQLEGARQQNAAYTLDALAMDLADLDYLRHVIQSLDRTLLDTFGQVLPDRRWKCRWVASPPLYPDNAEFRDPPPCDCDYCERYE